MRKSHLEISQRVLYHSLIGFNIRTIDYADVYKDRKKNVYSDSSISEAATFFYMSAIVKNILEVRAYRKASVLYYQNVETIVGIPRV